MGCARALHAVAGLARRAPRDPRQAASLACDACMRPSPCLPPPQPGSEKPEASGLRPTDVVSQLDVVKLLAANKDKLELVRGRACRA
jgi:hypothetical protein